MPLGLGETHFSQVLVSPSMEWRTLEQIAIYRFIWVDVYGVTTTCGTVNWAQGGEPDMIPVLKEVRKVGIKHTTM